MLVVEKLCAFGRWHVTSQYTSAWSVYTTEAILAWWEIHTPSGEILHKTWQEALKPKQEEEKELLHFSTCVGCFKSSGQSIQHQHKTNSKNMSSYQKDQEMFRMQYLQCLQSARLNSIPSSYFRLYSFMLLLWTKILTECRQWNLGVMKSSGRMCVNFSGTGTSPTKSWHLL